MKRLLLAAIILLLVASATFFANRWRNAESRLEKNTAWTHSFMDSLGSTIEFPAPPYMTGARDSVYWQWVATSATLKVRMAQQIVRDLNATRADALDDSDVFVLKQRGLADPSRELRQSLEAHVDLIPYEAVLGGTMGFHQIVLLPNGFVFAEFDDGHIQGHMLLSYEVEDGKIEWKRLWAELI
jgi:hypothetical protein